MDAATGATGVETNAASNEASGHCGDEQSHDLPTAVGCPDDANHKIQGTCDSNSLTRTPSEKLQGRTLTPFAPDEVDPVKSA